MSKPLTKAGRYQLVSELGRGAMGVVYEGYDPVIGRSVAIKTMLTEGLSGNEFETYRARFQREAQAAGMLAHPNIVTIYDFGEDEGFLYLAMELLRGKSLEKLLQEQSMLPIETIIPIYQQVCSALDYAHDHKIVHRDIKPANIMILENGVVKVADFGIAKMMATGMTRAGQILGTPNYMSPEQVKGRGVDGRSDIFALGVILYELVTGEKPFSGQNVTTVIYKIMHENPIPPRELEPTIHPGLSSVITKALAKGMDERYQSCRELAEDLKNYRNLAAPAATSSTAVIQRPMIELAPDATAAIDLPSLREPANARPASPVRTPPVSKAPAPGRSAPQAPPPPRVQASPPLAQVSPVRAEPLPQPPPVQPLPVAPAPVSIKTYAEFPFPADPVQLDSVELDSVQVEAPPAEHVESPVPPARRRISPLVWAGAAALLLIATVGGYFMPHGQRPAAPRLEPTQTAPTAPSTAANPGQTAVASSPAQGTAEAGQVATGTKRGTEPPPPPSKALNQAQQARSQSNASAVAAATRPEPTEPKTQESKAPKAPVAKVGPGQVSVTANVEGARVSIDGKGEPDWVAPHTFSLPAGHHQIAVLKDGFVTWGKMVDVEAGSTQSISAELAPPTGEVDIDTVPSGLEVFIDGKSVGVTPVRTSASVGDHKYSISPPPGQAPYESTITVKETSIARKMITFR